MGLNSKIQWTDHTWNPWRGCTKVSPGCDNCYMFREQKRYGFDPDNVSQTRDTTFRAPLSYVHYPDGARVFTCSWSDFFHPAADEWRKDAWDIIRSRPGLIFQILTKRPERLYKCLPADWGEGWSNVWLGVTAENQEMADERIPHLLAESATVKFVSIEPMLGPVDLTWFLGTVHSDDVGFINPDQGIPGRFGIPFYDPWIHGLNWVIVGGESGPDARLMEPDWARSIRDQCAAARVPFFMKQMTGRTPIPFDLDIQQFPGESCAT